MKELEFTMKCTQKSRGNVARFTVVQNKDANKENDLRASGMPNYGELSLVIPHNEDYTSLKEGDEYNLVLSEMAEEATEK